MALQYDFQNEAGKNAETLATGLNASANTFMFGAHHMQALTSEAMKMSMESLQRASQTLQQMKSARSWEEVVKIESDFVMSSLEVFTTHAGKMVEIASAIPAEMTRKVSSVASATREAAQSGADAAINRVGGL